MAIGGGTALGPNRGGDHSYRMGNNIHRINDSDSDIQLKSRSAE